MDLCIISSRMFFHLLSCVFFVHSFLFFSGIQQLCRDFSNHWHSCPVLALYMDKTISYVWCGVRVRVLVSIYLLAMVLEPSLLTYDTVQRVRNISKIYNSNAFTYLIKRIAIVAMFPKVYLIFSFYIQHLNNINMQKFYINMYVNEKV